MCKPVSVLIKIDEAFLLNGLRQLHFVPTS